jgi:hypothetical protein
MAKDSPIFDPIGNSLGGDSMAIVAREASTAGRDFTASYENKVLDYCIEWERIISARIETELNETSKMKDRLNHYQNKIMELRAKVNHSTDKSIEPPKKLSVKLERNETKLNKAWKDHEQCASKLCTLIEEITDRKWKDLYPLVKASMQWEVERVSTENEVFAKLPLITDILSDTFENGMSTELTVSLDSVAMADENDSQTTCSLHSDGDVDTLSSDWATAAEGVDDANLPASPKRSERPKVISAPRCPKVVDHI